MYVYYHIYIYHMCILPYVCVCIYYHMYILPYIYMYITTGIYYHMCIYTHVYIYIYIYILYLRAFPPLLCAFWAPESFVIVEGHLC